jgi:hypothetical protein
MSVPCPAEPSYTVQAEHPTPFSLCAGVREGEDWKFATGADTVYEVLALSEGEQEASAALSCRFENGKTVNNRYTVSERGVSVELDGEGEIAFSLPAFDFDGEAHTEITADKHTLEIAFEGWVCRYSTDGEVVDLGFTAENRNGRYRAFAAVGKDALRVNIEILQA